MFFGEKTTKITVGIMLDLAQGSKTMEDDLTCLFSYS